MSIEFAPGPTSLDRLETALNRMVQKHGFIRVDRNPGHFSAGLAALLLTDDPQRNLEVLDACVILPEALKGLGDAIVRLVAGPESAPALMQQYAIARAPAVVFLRDGNYVGSLNGIRDWQAYRDEIARLSTAPTTARPIPIIPIPVRSSGPSGACA